MKVLVMTDIEGVAGVVSFEDQTYANAKHYEQAKALLTAEVNAAVEAMLAEGVDGILVVDGHGPGGIRFEDLHPSAKLLHGRPLPMTILRTEIVKNYDAAIMIGQHAMAGTERGNLNHTQSSATVEYYKLNGKAIGEIAQFALYCGALGLPMVFLSGDDAACKETEALIEGVTTTAVKQGLTRTSAISLAAPESHHRIGQGIKQALRKHADNPLKPLVWPGPYVLEKRFLFTETADRCDSNPLYDRVDAKTVRLESDNILDIIYA